MENGSAKVNGDRELGVQTEVVEQTETGSNVSSLLAYESAGVEVRNAVVKPLLLVSPELVADVPEEVGVNLMIAYTVGVEFVDS